MVLFKRISLILVMLLIAVNAHSAAARFRILVIESITVYDTSGNFFIDFRPGDVDPSENYTSGECSNNRIYFHADQPAASPLGADRVGPRESRHYAGQRETHSCHARGRGCGQALQPNTLQPEPVI